MTPTRLDTIVEALLRHASAEPAQPAYIDEQGSISHATLWDATARRADWMFRQGVRPGEVVALSLDVDLQGARRAVELFYAAAYLGAVVLPLQPEVPQAACEELMSRFGARWLIAIRAPVVVAGARSLNPLGYEAVPGNFRPGAAPRGDMPDAPLFYSLTSGTSGEPKPLLFTNEQVYRRSMAGARSVGMRADDRQMACVDWPSNFGLRYMLRAHVVGAAFVAVKFRDTRSELARILEKYAVTHLTGSPWQVRRLLQSPMPPGGMPPLRSFHVTGAPISPEDVMAARNGITSNIYPGYAANEVGALTIISPGEQLEAGCVGSLLEGVQAKVDLVHDTPVSGGMPVGELAFRTPWMCNGYAGNAAATQAHFRDGWFFPGDVGRIDAQGRLWLHGRSSEAINYGGLKIWPEDVEAVLKRHPAVADAALAALPDAMAGQVPAAFIVARGVLTEQSLRAHCAAHLEGGRIPPHIVVVEKIPRNANGKILRQALVDAHLPAIQNSVRWRAGLP
jgi:acyl-coenzyme A synthetase/AMP-(fatty) acid ligase